MSDETKNSTIDITEVVGSSTPQAVALAKSLNAKHPYSEIIQQGAGLNQRQTILSYAYVIAGYIFQLALYIGAIKLVMILIK